MSEENDRRKRLQTLRLFKEQNQLFTRAISRRIFPGCSVAFGDGSYRFYRSFGRVSFEPQAEAVQTWTKFTIPQILSEEALRNVIDVGRFAERLLNQKVLFQLEEDGCFIRVNPDCRFYGVLLCRPSKDMSKFQWKFFKQLERYLVP